MGAYSVYQGRIEDDRFITGHGQYIDDLILPDMAHAAMMRAQTAHAHFTTLDISNALAYPGVIAIYTAKDLAAHGVGDQSSSIAHKRPDGQDAFKAGRRILARDKIHHLGEPIAMVIAETRAAAEAAVELIDIDTDDLEPVTDARQAITANAPLVWEKVKDNIAFTWSKGALESVDQALSRAAYVAHLDSHVTRVSANPMEPRGIVAEPNGDGRLTVYASTQNPYPLRYELAAILGIPKEHIRVRAGDVGGSFGMKSGVYPEDVLVSWAACQTGRPIKWISQRGEGLIADEHGRDVHISADLALDNDGNFLALKVSYLVNIGAYLSQRSVSMIGNIGGMAGVYRIGAIWGEIKGVHTHTQVTAPYRGAGRPEATYAIERTIDIAAREMGIDPFDLRRRNLIPPKAMPYDTGFTFTYDCGQFEQNMLSAAQMSDRQGFEQRQILSKACGKLRGLGIANAIEVAGGPYTKPRKDCAKLKISADGTVTLYAGAMSVGQGLETAFSDMVARRLGIPTSNIIYRQGDTEDLDAGRGSGGSSSTPVGASAVANATDALIKTALPFAAELLQIEANDIVFDGGVFSFSGTGSSVSLMDAARHAISQTAADLVVEGEFTPSSVTYPNGTHMCEVEIDPLTGELEIVGYWVAEDIGIVLNPILAEGQMHGGIAMGASQSLFEQAIYDTETGQLLTGSFMDYAMPRADDFPLFAFRTHSVPTSVNPIGAKGIGEAGTVGSMVAVINAVCDALAPLGIRHIEMPLTPARIWTAIQAAQENRVDGDKVYIRRGFITA